MGVRHAGNVLALVRQPAMEYLLRRRLRVSLHHGRLRHPAGDVYASMGRLGLVGAVAVGLLSRRS